MPVIPPDQAGNTPTPQPSLADVFVQQETPLLRYAMKLVGNEEVAQDLVQEAFMRIHSRFATIRHHRAWLYRTVHNLAINHFRAESRIVPFQDLADESRQPSDPQPQPDEQVARLEAADITRLFLQDLDDRSRNLVRLKYEEDLSYKEMSACTGISVSNVGYLLHHALKNLATELTKSGHLS